MGRLHLQIHRLNRWVLLVGLVLAAPGVAVAQAASRPFGTLREQAEIQQAWLAERLSTTLPRLMRQYDVDMWVIPMREYHEDPVFRSMVSPTTFAARRRTIYVFFDRGAERGVERIALGGSSQGGLYEAVRTTTKVDAAVAGENAELWGDQQWEVLKQVLEERNPKRIAVNTSRVWAFADGLSSGELDGMQASLDAKWTSRFVPAEGLAVDFIARRLPEEEGFYSRLQALVWDLIGEMFSERVITPGETRTSDLVWWWRQQVNDLGLGTWFQPSMEVQREGASDQSLGTDPVIQRGDVLHCDVGITALGLNTDTQHMAYVLRVGETDAPAGLRKALANSNRLQDLLFEETRGGRTGNEILTATRGRMQSESLNGTVYSHPIGVNGHGAGPLIGLWDYQEGVPGRGDHPVITNMWYSSELQVTTPIPEWNGQPVRMAQEEDFFVGPEGRPRWAHRRQSVLHLIH
ncbi:MAG: M24 family metallopeptidase [Gemmatimonadales bacterium]|nr:MAG: M24 family metallopeptidase [Gemmatimonadales bacterium]